MWATPWTRETSSWLMTEPTTSLMGCGVGVSATHTHWTAPAILCASLWISLDDMNGSAAAESSVAGGVVSGCYYQNKRTDTFIKC